MITREDAIKLGQSLYTPKSTYAMKMIFIEKLVASIYDSIEQPKLCNTCTRDHCGCSIQDSILQVEPDATFDTFGCVHHDLLTQPTIYDTIQH